MRRARWCANAWQPKLELALMKTAPILIQAALKATLIAMAYQVVHANRNVTAAEQQCLSALAAQLNLSEAP